MTHTAENDACPLTCLNRLAPTCVIHRPPAENDAPARLANACACGDCYHPVIGPNTDGEPCDYCRDCGCPSADHARMTRVIPPGVASSAPATESGQA